nr:hypothetical protein [Tanacetum cinerariifolium]
MIHKFYQDPSFISRSDDDGAMITITTMKGINDKMCSMDYTTYKDGVIVLVIGFLTRKRITEKGSSYKVFFLAPQDNDYFALNDISTYADESKPIEDNHVVFEIECISLFSVTGYFGLSHPSLRDTLGYPVLRYGTLWVISSSVTGYFGLSRPPLRDTLGYLVLSYGILWTELSRFRRSDCGGLLEDRKHSIQCSVEESKVVNLRTCKQCKKQFDPVLNHPQACRFHTAHFGGETKRKFESAYSGGTMNTPDSGKVFQYWHCCASEDPFDPGCTASPHCSYDD